MNVSCPEAALPIGVFDSGVGGLSVLKELRVELPEERFMYLSDNLHIPYGSRPLLEVRGFCEAIAEYFAAVPVKMIVVACNTASAAALMHLRALFPALPFIGMEPAIKPAAAGSRSGKIGVLATEATFQGELFENVVERFAGNVDIFGQPCHGLAEFIERHGPNDPGLEHLLSQWIPPLVAAGIDNLVLACTHYPLVKDLIADMAGPGVRIVDPSSAIARRARQVLTEKDLLRSGVGDECFFATGDARAFADSASLLLGREITAEPATLKIL